MIKPELCGIADRSKHHPELNLSNASLIRHEICTPLSVIMGAADVLKKQLLDENQQKQIEAIFMAGKRLLEISEKILGK